MGAMSPVFLCLLFKSLVYFSRYRQKHSVWGRIVYRYRGFHADFKENLTYSHDRNVRPFRRDSGICSRSR